MFNNVTVILGAANKTFCKRIIIEQCHKIRENQMYNVDNNISKMVTMLLNI